MPDLQPTTVELPALCRRAAITPSTIDDENRTVELIFSTGAAVRRHDYWTGKSYIEKLSMDPAHIRLDRLNSGGPLLDAHSGYSIADQIGVVEDGSARVVGKKAVATVRFSSRAQVQDIWTDVREKIIRNVSVGYIVHRFEEVDGKDGGIPTRTATDWEPYELSLVPMPADAGAQTRGGKPGKPAGDTYPCQILTRGEAPLDDKEDKPMEERTQPETLVEQPPVQRLALGDPPAPSDADLATRAERERIEGINHAARSARMPSAQLDKFIADGTPLPEVQRAALELVRTRGGDDKAGPQAGGGRTDVVMGDDPLVHLRAGIENALKHRVAPHYFPLTDDAKNYRTMSVLDTAELFLKHRGIRTTSLTRTEIVKQALELRTGYHTTSDFAEILGNVVKATLRAAYGEEPQTFAPIARRVTATDFKQMRRIQIGNAPDLEKVLEHGEFTRGTITESKETMQLETYGRIFAITRQALVNDDLDAFSTIPTMFGRSARKKESDIVWGVITDNAAMADTFALFSAQHANLETDGDVISVASMSRARLAMRLQTYGGSRIGLVPRILIVPPSLETAAEQFLAPIVAAQTTAAQNIFAGKFQLIVEPRLEDDSTTAWYVAADASQLPVIEYAYLDGQEGVSIETRSGFDIDGLEIRARLDFDAAAIDYRGIHKDPGEAVS